MIYYYKDECFLQHSSVSVSDCSYYKRTPEHKHSFFEIAYIVNGTGFHIIDGKSIPIKSGDYFLLDTTVSHYYDGNINVINLVFKPSFLDKNYRDILTVARLCDRITFKTDYRRSVKEPVYHTYCDDGFVRRRIEYIKDEIRERKFSYEECVRIALSEIVMYTVRSIVCVDTNSNIIKQIEKKILKLKERLEEME